MLDNDPPTGSVSYNTPFTQVITITSSTDIPSVTASVIDPGVTITTSSGTVTLSGKYTSVPLITWHWLDFNLIQHSGSIPPAVGTYKKIIGVDSPSSRVGTCVYTITTSATNDTFTETVTIPSFDVVANLLKTLLASTS